MSLSLTAMISGSDSQEGMTSTLGGDELLLLLQLHNANGCAIQQAHLRLTFLTELTVDHQQPINLVHHH
jgi:hypothetical protein